MIDLEKEITSDINWRLGELSALKTIPYRYQIRNSDKAILIKYAVPAIYSLWEGFVVNSFQLYIREINKLSLKRDEMCINLLTHAIDADNKLSLDKSRTNLGIKIEFIETLSNFMDNSIVINPKLPTNSNVNFKTINDLLLRFNLEPLPDQPFSKLLSKLIIFRNAIAHGDNSLPVDSNHISEFSSTLNELMSEILIRISEGYRKEQYRR